MPSLLLVSSVGFLFLHNFFLDDFWGGDGLWLGSTVVDPVEEIYIGELGEDIIGV